MASFQPVRVHQGTKATSSTTYASGKMKLVTFNVPREVKAHLWKVAKARKMSGAMILRAALEEYFAKDAAEAAAQK
jgi:hypothetical protein